MNRARIGIFLKSGPDTGPGRYVRSLLRTLNREEFEVVMFEPALPVAACAGGESEEVPVARHPHLARSRTWARALTPSPVKYWLGFERETRRLADMFRRRPVDLLHTNDTGCEESALAARLGGVPAVLGTFHVLPDVDVQRCRQRWIHKHLTRRAVNALDLGIAVSEAGRAAWMGHAQVPPSRIVTIHNGIDPQEFVRRRTASAARRALGIPSDDIVIGTVARLSRVKGLEHLIAAAARLRMQSLQVRVVIAGDGELLEELRRCAGRIGAGSYVHFVGHRADVAGVLEAFDIFALPSLSEALPYAVMEAMAMELPVVASDVGGVPEIVAPDQTGFLVPAGNAEALEAALRPLVESDELRARMGRAGRRRIIECFDERTMADRTVRLYRSMLDETGRVRRGIGAPPVESIAA